MQHPLLIWASGPRLTLGRDPCLDPLRDSARCGCHVLMLPETDDLPSGLPQPRVGVGVAGAVRLELAAPPLGVRLGPGTVLGAGVPEAAVREDGHPSPREENVRPPPKARQRGAVDPEAQAEAVEGRAELDLGPRVAPTRPLHPQAGVLGRRRRGLLRSG